MCVVAGRPFSALAPGGAVSLRDAVPASGTHFSARSRPGERRCPRYDRLANAGSRDVPSSSTPRFHVIRWESQTQQAPSRRESSINGSIQALGGPPGRLLRVAGGDSRLESGASKGR